MKGQGKQDVVVGVWEVATDRRIATVEPIHEVVRGVALSGDGRVLAVWGSAYGAPKDVLPLFRTVQLWDTRANKALKPLQLPQLGDDYRGCLEVALSPDGKQAVVHTGFELSVWDVPSAKEVGRYFARSLWEPSDRPHYRYSDDGKRFLGLGPGLGVQMWDAQTWKRLGVFDGEDVRHESRTSQPPIVVTPDGRIFALTATRTSYCLWDLRAGKRLTPIRGHDEPVVGVAFLGAKRLRSVSQDGIACTWDAATGRALQHSRLEANSEYHDSRLSPDGQVLLTGSRQARELDSGRLLWEIPKPTDTFNFALLPGSAGFSPCGRYVVVPARVSPTKGVLLQVLDLLIGKKLAELPGIRGRLTGMALSPNATTTVVTFLEESEQDARPRRHRVLALDVATRKELWSHTNDQRGWFSPRVSSDGTLLAVAGPAQRATLLNPLTGEEVMGLGGASTGAIAGPLISPDCRTIAISGETVGIWEVASGTERLRLSHPNGHVPRAYSPDGARLASVEYPEKSMLVWDLTGRHAAKPATKAELETLWSALRSPDGREAFAAMSRLMVAPELTVPLLARQLRPVPPVSFARIAELIADLEHRQFARRERAFAALEELGPGIMPELRRLLTQKPTLEMRRRTEELLRRLSNPFLSREVLQGVRAVEVLERIGSKAAKQLLSSLANGANLARLTRDAKAALARLQGGR